MKNHLLIGTGGALGALCRFLCSSVPMPILPGFPIHTLLINITGSFFLSMLLTLYARFKNRDIELWLIPGFFGAFTTFSALCRETVLLLAAGRAIVAFSYIVLSMLLGLMSISLGRQSACLLRKCFKQTDTEVSP